MSDIRQWDTGPDGKPLSPMCRAALALIAMGFAVFPLKVKGKLPALMSWPTRATRDPHEAIMWWSRPHGDPNYNVGILCGAHDKDAEWFVVVIDFDGKNGKPGIELFRNYKLKGVLNTLICKTPNGYHAFFKSRIPLANSVGRIAHGIDVRGWHGYVVGAGSLLDSGARYEWLDSEALRLGLIEIAELPEEFALAAAKATPEEAENSNVIPIVPELDALLDNAQAIERAIAWLINTAPQAIEGQGGDNITFFVAQRCRAFGLREPTTLDLMLRYWNEEKASPPWAPDDLARKVSNAFTYARRPPGYDAPEIQFSSTMAVTLDQPDEQPPPPDDPIERIANAAQSGQDAFFDPAEEHPPSSATSSPQHPRWRLRGRIDLLGLDFAPLPVWDYTVAGFGFVRGTVVHFTGLGGSGKTNLELQKNVQHAMGGLWLEQQCVQGPTLYIGAEDSIKALTIRLMLIAQYYGYTFKDLHSNGLEVVSVDDAPEPPLLCTFDREGKIQPTKFFLRLLEYCRDIRPINISLDPLSLLFGGNENDRSHVYQFIALLRLLAKATNGTVTLLAHPSKDGLRSGDGYSGSTAWHGAVRARQYLEIVTDEETKRDRGIRLLQTAKSQYSPPVTDIILVWNKGLYVPKSALQQQCENERADYEFLERLRVHAADNRHVCDHNKLSNYAPRIFAEEMSAEIDPVSKEQFELAMRRLLATGKIRYGKYRRDYKERDCLMPNEPGDPRDDLDAAPPKPSLFD